jgi:hypothetical protein
MSAPPPTAAEYLGVLAQLLAAQPADQPDLTEQLHAAYLAGLAAGLFGATTPANGLPYPAPTDPVAAGADNIRALAETVDALVFPKDYRAINGTSAVSISNNVWTKVGVWLAAEPGSVGSGITSSANGLQLLNPGVYLITGMVEWAGSSAVGRRLLGFGPAAGSGPGALWRSSNTPPDASACDQTYAETIYVDAASVGSWSLWAHQLTGATLTLANRRFTARRTA